MKNLIKVIIAVVACSNYSLLLAQDVYATYSCQIETKVVLEDGYVPKLPPLDFSVEFYKKGNKFISFFRPLYLDKYPDGKITYSNPNRNDNYTGFYGLNMDTTLYFNYKNMDSLFWIYTNYTNGTGAQQPYSFFIERGFMQWEILPETKEISGLTCQRAILKSDDGITQWDVWFCPDIPIECNIQNIFGLPGLLVNGKNASNQTYTLEAYQLNIDIDDQIFKPEIFNKKIVHRGIIRNRNKN